MAKELTAAEKIFSYGFQIRLPTMFVYSDNELKMYGVPYTGDAAYDRECAEEKMTVTVTINTIVEYYRRGLKKHIEFVNIRDTVRIYEIINEHLTDWLLLLHNAVSPKMPPTEDLRLLDELATVTYLKARPYLAEGLLKRDWLAVFNNEQDTISPMAPTIDRVASTVARDTMSSTHTPKFEEIHTVLQRRIKPWQQR